MNIDELYAIILKRKKDLPANSYVTTLLQAGENKILKKIGEESVEVIISAKDETKQRIVEETADLLFHVLVLLAEKNIKPADLYQELQNRNKEKNIDHS